MQTNYFNIDKSVIIQADHDSDNVVYLWAIINGKTKSFCDMVSIDRALNVRAVIEFMLKDKKAVSCETVCGLTIYRGVVK